MALRLVAIVPKRQDIRGDGGAASGSNCQLASPSGQRSYRVNSLVNLVVVVPQLDPVLSGDRFFVRNDILRQPFDCKSVGPTNPDDNQLGPI